jgi:REP element-mobilizing transposase RayT
MSEAICGAPEKVSAMVRYRRNFLAGGTYFFTVTLADRKSTMLVDCIAELRAAFRAARSERRFSIDAIVILPDHLHAILTRPPDDADFSGRWRRIKGHFCSTLIDAGSGSKPSATTRISPATSTTSISVRSNTAWCHAWPNGRTRHFIASSGKRFSPKIGPRCR